MMQKQPNSIFILLMVIALALIYAIYLPPTTFAYGGGYGSVAVGSQTEEALRLSQSPNEGRESVDGIEREQTSALPSDLIEWDWNDRSEWQVIVDREAGTYLGHPTTCLLEDGRTMLIVYPEGHGRGAIRYKRSRDGGVTWSETLPTPASWASSKETPTLHRVLGPDGTRRLLLFSGLYPARMSISDDDGETWSELEPVGSWGGIVVMSSVVELRTGPGHYLAMFHDDGRFLSRNPERNQPVKFQVLQSQTTDGGVTWSTPRVVWGGTSKHLCEPGVIRSPDGTELACLLRENSRKHPSHVMFSQDEGVTWSDPQALPKALNGDRHVAKYLNDGRLVISFRQMNPAGQTGAFQGDWVAWVGAYEDLSRGTAGEYLIRLKDNHHAYDCGYPGVEILPDGTVVLTTYGHWAPGESPYILSVRVPAGEIPARRE